ncbi:MAG: hypothetical protein K2Y39_22615 [Candidatus Obscuribacterales bacterium]|nr:hypothetical protein [Candidatus Obscuribacterales bacterium]
MKNRHFLAFAVSSLVALFSNSMVFAAEVSGSVETTPLEVQYTCVSGELAAHLKQLEGLGGGIAPFVTRQKQIDQVFVAGDHEGAVKDLVRLNQNVSDQLANLKALRAVKRPAAQPKVASAAPVAAPGGLSVSSASMNDLSKLMVVSQGAGNYSNYEGDADGFAKMVAKDIISRELGNLGIPCKGPFRVERFRNLQRINELRQKGQRIDGYLDFHKRTEELASLAKNDPSRLGQLSSEVRYLEQQLGLSPLTGSLKISTY